MNKINLKVLLEMIDQEIENPTQMIDAPKKETNDHEGSMARGELRSMIANGTDLYNMLQEKDELPGWVSAYITLASDYMNSVAGYMREKHGDGTDASENMPESVDSL